MGPINCAPNPVRTHILLSLGPNQVSAFTKSNKEGKDQESIHTNGKVTNSQIDITNESQEVPAVTTRHQ